MSATEMKNVDTPYKLRGAPFRLLSIVNLMNRAGDIDDRGLKPITVHPRSMGEIHLVFGYVDKKYEEKNNYLWGN